MGARRDIITDRCPSGALWAEARGDFGGRLAGFQAHGPARALAVQPGGQPGAVIATLRNLWPSQGRDYFVQGIRGGDDHRFLHDSTLDDRIDLEAVTATVYDKSS